MRIVPLAIVGLFVLMAHSSCSSPESGSTDGNTSWLTRCDSDADCDRDLGCECGFCTKRCSDRGDCSGLRGARCAASMTVTPACESAEGRVCAQSCSSTADCPPGLDACDGGVCVVRRVATEAGPGTDGGSGPDGATCKSVGAPCVRFDECCSEQCNAGSCVPDGTLGCSLEHAPPPPTSEPSDPPLGPLFFAVRAFDWGDSSPNLAQPPTRFREIGLDLDDHCTAEGNPGEGECRLPPWATGIVDGPGGVDNAFGATFQGIRNIITNFSSESYSAAIEEGGRTLALELSDWNGQPDDTQVTLAAYSTSPFDSFGGGASPAWDGNDAWPISAASLVNMDRQQPRFRDRFAYVANMRLVANLDEWSFRFSMPLSIGSLELEAALTSITVSCRIEPSLLGHGWSLRDCEAGGRWGTDHLLHQVSQFPDPSAVLSVDGGFAIGSPLCRNSPLYGQFKAGICAATDIYSGAAVLTTHCDSLSVGFAFQAEPAVLGIPFADDAPTPRCPTAVDPSEDSCDPDLASPDPVSNPESDAAANTRSD